MATRAFLPEEEKVLQILRDVSTGKMMVQDAVMILNIKPGSSMYETLARIAPGGISEADKRKILHTQQITEDQNNGTNN